MLLRGSHQHCAAGHSHMRDRYGRSPCGRKVHHFNKYHCNVLCPIVPDMFWCWTTLDSCALFNACNRLALGKAERTNVVVLSRHALPCPSFDGPCGFFLRFGTRAHIWIHVSIQIWIHIWVKILAVAVSGQVVWAGPYGLALGLQKLKFLWTL